ncbi:NlpC/P60 family protein [Streptomyces sp. NPDC007162]|uniref:C40 family peptidase n=1 Tax=Streptomyces sp. NPDC007162 TaxID=3156917 RepID=UPI0033E65A1F
MASESRDEVRQRINNLYDQAENATGNYNATRAMSGGSRSRGVPLFKRQRTDDPGLDNIAREWFEGARAKLGPSVPAALPSDRMPERPGPRRPVSAMAADLLSQLEDSGPARPALPAGPSAQSGVEVVRELPAERPKLELTAGPVAALPAGGPIPSSPPKALSAAAPRRTAPGTSKTKSQLKVAKARELLSQRTGQPAQTSQNPWPMPETRVPAQEWSTAAVGIPAQRTDSGAFRTDALAGTGVLPAMTVTETGAIPPVPTMDTGGFRVMTPGAGAAQNMPPADTDSYRTMTPGAGDAAQAVNPMTDSGGFRVMTPGNTNTAPATNPITDSGAFRVMTPGNTDATPATNPITDSGAFRVMTPGGTGAFPTTAAGPSPADTGSFRIMTPGATGTFPMPSAPDSGAFPTTGASGTGAFPSAAPITTGAFPTAAPAPVPVPVPAPIDTGSFQVMSPQAAAYAATYATAPAATPGMGYPTGGYDTAAQAATAVMPAVPPMPAGPPTDPGMGAYPMAPAADMAAYAAGMQPAASGYPTAMAMTPPPAPAPTPMPMPMPMPMPSTPMPPVMAAPPAAMPLAQPAMTVPPAAVAAAPAAMATAPVAVMTAPPMAMTPAVPVVTAPAPAPAAFPQAVAVAEPGKAMRALEFARAQIGRPCVWGATGPESYDCSSLTQAAWRAAGVTLPRTAPEQTLAGTPVTLAAVEPGDLVFFFDNDSHVGIYAGGGTMIHAPSPGASIREESIYNAGESAIHRVIRPA